MASTPSGTRALSATRASLRMRRAQVAAFSGDQDTFRWVRGLPGRRAVDAHVHLPVVRQVVGTSELLVVRSRCIVDIYPTTAASSPELTPATPSCRSAAATASGCSRTPSCSRSSRVRTEVPRRRSGSPTGRGRPAAVIPVSEPVLCGREAEYVAECLRDRLDLVQRAVHRRVRVVLGGLLRPALRRRCRQRHCRAAARRCGARDRRRATRSSSPRSRSSRARSRSSPPGRRRCSLTPIPRRGAWTSRRSRPGSRRGLGPSCRSTSTAILSTWTRSSSSPSGTGSR